jgi:sirohydrochlorin ferrochelatase
MDFILRQSSGVRERLANVFLLEVRQFLDDLCRCHPVRDKVDDVRDGDAKAADRRPAGEDIRVLGNAIECVGQRRASERIVAHWGSDDLQAPFSTERRQNGTRTTATGGSNIRACKGAISQLSLGLEQQQSSGWRLLAVPSVLP